MLSIELFPALGEALDIHAIEARLREEQLRG
jgi:hypothetical protein